MSRRSRTLSGNIMAKTDPVPPLPIEEDATESLIEWVRTNSKAISIGAMVVVAVAAIGLLWRASAEKKEVRASEALASAQAVVQSGNAALAQSDLTAMIQRYGGTKAGTQARLLLAQVMFAQSKFEEGLRELEAVGPQEPFVASYHALKAAGLEQTNKPAEAAAEYERAANAAATDLAKASYQSDAARTHLVAGNRDAALRIWEAMAADDANPLAGEAKVRVGELKAKPIG
jgi:predicted negative regulator of RcsB-dependent stress response